MLWCLISEETDKCTLSILVSNLFLDNVIFPYTIILAVSVKCTFKLWLSDNEKNMVRH